MLKKFGGIAVAIVIGLAFFGYQTFKAKGDAPKVGECVTISGSTSDVDVDTADCGGDDVLFKVVADNGKCDETENKYTVEVRGRDAVSLCLFPEVSLGDCIDIGDAKTIETKVPCTQEEGSGAIVKVVKADYASGDAKCPTEAFAMNNQTRGATICLGANA